MIVFVKILASLGAFERGESIRIRRLEKRDG